jgi:acyl transferase domain-containing protein
MNEPIAVIGSACRFAGGAHTPADLWRVLQNPRDLRRPIPSSRFNADAFYAPDGAYHGHSNVRHAYLLDEEQDIAAFDAEFFGIKPVEAAAMDPQQRFLLEVVYEALENSGIPVSETRGSNAGVYVGVMFNDYATMLLRDYQEVPTYYATGTGISVLSNRISHFFDWHGPSMTVDTACSSSLVAVHLAVQALRSGDSRMAIACGTNLIIGPEAFIIESKLNMLSPDGRSRMWDQGANGYARGEGVAAVVLKTLSAALEDGDQIECIIRETGVNQDGATPGLTMPSATSQESLMRSLYRKAGLNILSPEQRPQYFEAHGTGTPAGDPIEAEAIFRTFCSQGVESGTLYVGSIKTVLGHTEGTAGIAALIKTLLAMQNGVIPPNLHLDKLSDRVEPFYKDMKIPQVSTPWPDTHGSVKRASINSFGFGGTNAHAIIETYDPSSRPRSNAGLLFTPFVFSASSTDSLRRVLAACASYFEDLDKAMYKPSLQDLAWTLRQRRSALPHRICFTASTFSALSIKIKSKLAESDFNNLTTKAVWPETLSTRPGGRILGIFTGQGAQYARMGAKLIESSQVARNIIRKLEVYLQELPEADRPTWSLETELLAGAGSSRIQQAEISQPLCTALQILLVDLLQLAGVQFSAVVGHSSGEIAAAYAAGWMTARDASKFFHSSNCAKRLGTFVSSHFLLMTHSERCLLSRVTCRVCTISPRLACERCNACSRKFNRGY